MQGGTRLHGAVKLGSMHSETRLDRACRYYRSGGAVGKRREEKLIRKVRGRLLRTQSLQLRFFFFLLRPQKRRQLTTTKRCETAKLQPLNETLKLKQHSGLRSPMHKLEWGTSSYSTARSNAHNSRRSTN